MLKLVVALAVVGALAAAVAYAPIRGRTIADRWNASPSAEAFASAAWTEARRAFSGGVQRDAEAPAPARRGATAAASRDAKRAGAKPMPVEHHTAEDRAALDRLLSERSH